MAAVLDFAPVLAPGKTCKPYGIVDRRAKVGDFGRILTKQSLYCPNTTDYSAMLCSLVGKHMMAALSGTLGRQITLKQLMGFDETIQ